jgi:DNA-binding response OmpR family regulator
MSRAGADDRLTVLLIEDDETIGRHVRSGLQTGEYDVRWCRTGWSGLIEARRTPPQLVLLDLGLPDIDGVEVARTLRGEHPGLLLVILTARGDDIDVIVGLDAGADDYLVKPFSLTVLLARLRAHLRRRPVAGAADPGTKQLGDLTLDLAARRCFLPGHEVELRPKEFELLAALAARPGTAVTREDLMAGVWDENWFGSTKTLDVTMAVLRRRLSEAATLAGAARLPTITTLRGYGYRLDSPS